MYYLLSTTTCGAIELKNFPIGYNFWSNFLGYKEGRISLLWIFGKGRTNPFCRQRKKDKKCHKTLTFLIIPPFWLQTLFSKKVFRHHVCYGRLHGSQNRKWTTIAKWYRMIVYVQNFFRHDTFNGYKKVDEKKSATKKYIWNYIHIISS